MLCAGEKNKNKFNSKVYENTYINCVHREPFAECVKMDNIRHAMKRNLGKAIKKNFPSIEEFSVKIDYETRVTCGGG